MLMPGSKRSSIVVIAKNEGDELRETLVSVALTVPDEVEIIVVDDGSTDGCADFLESGGRVRLFRCNDLGVASARNFGAREAVGDYLFFLDAHMRFPETWLEPLIELLERPGTGAAAPAIYDLDHPDNLGCGLRFKAQDLSVGWYARNSDEPHAAPILPGCCVGMRRDIFVKTGGFDGGLLSTGSVDNELGIRFWTLGYQLLVDPSIAAGHRFRPRHPYPVYWSTMLHNRLRLAFVHCNRDRIERIALEFKGHHALPAAIALMAESDAAARRASLAAERIHDDEWFFSRFSMPF